jgi:hypothetical protein
MIVNIALPTGVDVSSAFWCETKSMFQIARNTRVLIIEDDPAFILNVLLLGLVDYINGAVGSGIQSAI